MWEISHPVLKLFSQPKDNWPLHQMHATNPTRHKIYKALKGSGMGYTLIA
jgi:hypothetical protein